MNIKLVLIRKYVLLAGLWSLIISFLAFFFYSQWPQVIGSRGLSWVNIIGGGTLVLYVFLWQFTSGLAVIFISKRRHETKILYAGIAILLIFLILGYVGFVNLVQVRFSGV